jgi:hypothetical protein
LPQVALDNVVSVVFKAFGIRLEVIFRLKRRDIGLDKAFSGVTNTVK